MQAHISLTKCAANALHAINLWNILRKQIEKQSCMKVYQGPATKKEATITTRALEVMLKTLKERKKLN